MGKSGSGVESSPPLPALRLPLPRSYEEDPNNFIVDRTEADFQNETFFNSSNPNANINEILENFGLKVKKEYLDAYLIELQSFEYFREMNDNVKALRCLDQFLLLDMKDYSRGVLPPNVQKMDSVYLKGPFMLQVDAITNVCSRFDKEYENVSAGYTKRMLKLFMTDGVQRVLGMEYLPIHELEVLSPAGLKVLVANVRVRDGVLLLVPEAVEVFGGFVEKLEAARQSFLNEIYGRQPWQKRVSKEVVNEYEKIVNDDNTWGEVEEAAAYKDKEIARYEEPEDKSINEFLKPSDGYRRYNSGARGRDRGRGGYTGTSNAKAPSIEDPDQFLTLGGK